MDEFEADYRSSVDAGQRNLRAIHLLRNWCFHAELARSPGRGMIEAQTGLPIGHMGVSCKFSKKNSMYCWLLEDAAYDFYQNNCKDCSDRVPVGMPNIMEFIGPREEAAEKRRIERQQEERQRRQKQDDRRNERAELRYGLSLDETFVFDLLDELDQDDIARDDPRLEELANLAPETFTRKIIEHLMPAVLDERTPYSIPAAKALLRAPLEPAEKLSVALRLVCGHEDSPDAVSVVLSNAEIISQEVFTKVLNRFVSMALAPPPWMHFGDVAGEMIDPEPAHSLFLKRRSDILVEVDTLLKDATPESIGAAVSIVLAIDSDELLLKYTRDIFTKLMRRRTLLPHERRNSSVLHYLRDAASTCLERFPTETDAVIQSLLADQDDIGRKEANRVYRSVFKHNYLRDTTIGAAQRVAFRRLLWAAVDSTDYSVDDAVEFFRSSWDELSQLAAENFDDLIGAAATLSVKYEQVEAEKAIELAENALTEVERGNKRSAIDSLQGSLIAWAAIGARSRGREGIEEFLNLYRRLPMDQTRMRGNMIIHVSTLLTGVESLTLVLSDWYRALMDESVLVRARAAQAWEKVPYDLVKNVPDLFFEAFSILLTDPYVIVHRSAVHALTRRPFPSEARDYIKHGLWKLIVYYSQERKKNDFVVDCVDAFAFLCLSPEERKGQLGQLLTAILLQLEGSALYHAVDRLHYGFKDVPGFAKVAIKSIRDNYTRSISIDDCAFAITGAPKSELQKCVDDIEQAFEALKPFRPEDFVEALLYAAALSKAGDHAAIVTCFKELTESIPSDARNKLWQLEAALVTTASDIERSIQNGEPVAELIGNWSNLLSELEKENEERAKLRNFPPSFLFEN